MLGNITVEEIGVLWAARVGLRPAGQVRLGGGRSVADGASRKLAVEQELLGADKLEGEDGEGGGVLAENGLELDLDGLDGHPDVELRPEGLDLRRRGEVGLLELAVDAELLADRVHTSLEENHKKG
jgi:hypothetical protein